MSVSSAIADKVVEDQPVDARATSATAPQPTPEMAANIERFQHAVQLGVGQVVLATMNLDWTSIEAAIERGFRHRRKE